MMKKITFACALFLLISTSAHSQLYDAPSLNEKDLGFYTPYTEELSRVRSGKVGNIIFFIGDGMGISESSAARIRALGADGELAFEKMPITGLVRTHSLDTLVTDSAASGTALASGYKTHNGMIGMFPDGRSTETILEAAQKKGLGTGLIATSTMTHATPASFGAHVNSRKNEATIAEHLLMNRINILFGGGLQFFIPKDVEGSSRKDNKDLLLEAKDAGYEIAQTKHEMSATDGDHILGLFALGALNTAKDPEPSLSEMTEKALEVLSQNKKGFFLMVEGSQIDWGGHANDASSVVRQVLLFDKAVQTALNFARSNRRTLVIVTADHETGGLAINDGGLSGQSVEIGWTTDHHTGVQVPLYAYGPGSERFVGVMDNTDIPRKFARLLKIKDFPRLVKND